jgi:hypothetical protein
MAVSCWSFIAAVGDRSVSASWRIIETTTRKFDRLAQASPPSPSIRPTSRKSFEPNSRCLFRFCAIPTVASFKIGISTTRANEAALPSPPSSFWTETASSSTHPLTRSPTACPPQKSSLSSKRALVPRKSGEDCISRFGTNGSQPFAIISIADRHIRSAARHSLRESSRQQKVRTRARL